ncbi:MAG: hypothetical protein IPK12_20285 [Gemmatimonadetes bacterium]|nr:hypothetical protein [Gemmatimonadota bacterium]
MSLPPVPARRTLFGRRWCGPWPTPPGDRLQIIGPLEAIPQPPEVWPFARMILPAFDLMFRPPTEKDLA